MDLDSTLDCGWATNWLDKVSWVCCFPSLELSVEATKNNGLQLLLLCSRLLKTLKADGNLEMILSYSYLA